MSISIAYTTARAPDMVVVKGTLYRSALCLIEKESFCACAPLTVLMMKSNYENSTLQETLVRKRNDIGLMYLLSRRNPNIYYFIFIIKKMSNKEDNEKKGNSNLITTI